MALYCICGKQMLLADNENVCVWCGHGDATAVAEYAYHRNMQRPAVRELPAPPRVVRVRVRGPLWTEEACIAAARVWEGAHGILPRSHEWEATLEPGEQRPSKSTVRRLFGGWGGFLNAIADVPRASPPSANLPGGEWACA